MKLERKFDEAILVSTGPSTEIDLRRADGATKRYLMDYWTFGNNPCVIVSGAYNKGRYDGSQSEAIHNRLLEGDVNPSHIFHEDRSDSPKGFLAKAVYVTQMLEQLSDPNSSINLSLILDKVQARRMTMLFKRAWKSVSIPRSYSINNFSDGQIPSYSGLKGLWKPQLTYLVHRFSRLPKPLPQEEIRRMTTPFVK
mgnify:CR=1 FL=1